MLCQMSNTSNASNTRWNSKFLSELYQGEVIWNVNLQHNCVTSYTKATRCEIAENYFLQCRNFPFYLIPCPHCESKTHEFVTHSHLRICTTIDSFDVSQCGCKKRQIRKWRKLLSANCYISKMWLCEKEEERKKTTVLFDVLSQTKCLLYIKWDSVIYRCNTNNFKTF